MPSNESRLIADEESHSACHIFWSPKPLQGFVVDHMLKIGIVIGRRGEDPGASGHTGAYRIDRDPTRS